VHATAALATKWRAAEARQRQLAADAESDMGAQPETVASLRAEAEASWRQAGDAEADAAAAAAEAAAAEDVVRPASQHCSPHVIQLILNPLFVC
jgi:hypothetical protein